MRSSLKKKKCLEEREAQEQENRYGKVKPWTPWANSLLPMAVKTGRVPCHTSKKLDSQHITFWHFRALNVVHNFTICLKYLWFKTSSLGASLVVQ